MALGLVHLAGNRLEIGVVDLSKGLHLGQGEGPELPDRDLLGADRQGEPGRRCVGDESGGQLGGGRGNQLGIDLGPLPLHVRSEGHCQGPRTGLGRGGFRDSNGCFRLLSPNGRGEQGQAQHTDQCQSGSGMGHALLKLVVGV